MNDSSRPLSLGIDRERLHAVVEPIVRAHGGEIVDIEFKTEPGGWVLRVFVEKLGSSNAAASTEQAAIDLGLCSGIARDLSPALDVADLIPHRYHLEISSPGVERPLRTERDFVRFSGSKAKLKLHDPVKGQKVLIGVLDGVQSNDVVLREGVETFSIPISNVAAARLVFEFGPAPRPGKSGKKKK